MRHQGNVVGTGADKWVVTTESRVFTLVQQFANRATNWSRVRGPGFDHVTAAFPSFLRRVECVPAGRKCERKNVQRLSTTCSRRQNARARLPSRGSAVVIVIGHRGGQVGSLEFLPWSSSLRTAQQKWRRRSSTSRALADAIVYTIAAHKVAADALPPVSSRSDP
jgi:hypothetical protein